MELISQVRRRTMVLFFMMRQTIGRFTSALAIEARTAGTARDGRGNIAVTGHGGRGCRCTRTAHQAAEDTGCEQAVVAEGPGQQDAADLDGDEQQAKTKDLG